jgi:flagellar basal body-associated protein FliL
MMRRRFPLCFGLTAAGTLLVLCGAPSSADDQPNEPAKVTEAALRTKVRELEERVAQLEKGVGRTGPLVTGDTILVGETVTNLAEGNLQRYLRCKIAIKVDPAARTEAAEAVVARRIELKNWVITFVAGSSLKDVSGSKNVERIQGEMKRAFGKILFPDHKANPIKEVLFEEYV